MNGTLTITALSPAAAPVMTPAAGTYTSAQSVTITDSTQGAALYYTTDGSTPTGASTLYTAPFSVGSSETIKAIALAGGYANSVVATAAYTINLPAADFGLSLSPAALTITAGSSGTATVTVTSLNGFNASVSFACSGLPTGATCGFSPAAVTPASSSAATTLTVTTPISLARTKPEQKPFWPTPLAATALCVFALRLRRRLLQRLALICICTGTALWISGCGGPSPSTSVVPQTTTSVITVTATSGALTHATMLTLSVN